VGADEPCAAGDEVLHPRAGGSSHHVSRPRQGLD
jgi:hypothetical protein